jgi:type IV pilus assembly protein PilC
MAKKLQRKVQVQVQRAVAPAAGGGGEGSNGALSRRFGRGRVTARSLTEFTNQLAVLLNAGIPISKGLRILEGQLPPGGMKRTTRSLLEEVEGGTSLSEAMAKHRDIFDPLYTNMVRAGEAGGVQEEILSRLALFLEKAQEIKGKVVGALAYPIVLCLVAGGVLVFAFAVVIPQLKTIFTSMNMTIDQMHWTTRMVIALGDHMKVWWWAYLVGVLLVWGLHLLMLQKVRAYRAVMHRLAIRIPIFGQLVHKNMVARFARTFGTLIQSGVPHLDALTILEDSTANVHMRSAVHSVHSSIREGAGIAIPMGESHMFDDIVVNMVEVGEQTGELDRMLVKIADRFEKEVDRTVETTFRVIEPILLLVMAVIVGFIVFALFTPLLRMMQQMNQHK